MLFFFPPGVLFLYLKIHDDEVATDDPTVIILWLIREYHSLSPTFDSTRGCVQIRRSNYVITPHKHARLALRPSEKRIFHRDADFLKRLYPSSRLTPRARNSSLRKVPPVSGGGFAHPICWDMKTSTWIRYGNGYVTVRYEDERYERTCGWIMDDKAVIVRNWPRVIRKKCVVNKVYCFT